MNKLKLCAATTFFMMFTSIASADVVPFQWSTSGSWTGSHPGLTFTGASTSAVTNTNAAGNLDINLGTFNLNQNGFNGSPSGTFALTVNFWRPNALVGGVDEMFSATFEGDTFFFVDYYTIDFSNTPRTINFNGTDGIGSFQFTVEDVSLNTRGFLVGEDLSDPLIGKIRNADISSAAAVPEPQSVLLLCTVLAGVALTARKKLAA